MVRTGRGRHTEAGALEAAQAARLAADGPASRPPPNALLELMAGQKATRVAAQAEMALKAVESELVATIAEDTRKLSVLRAAAIEADSQLQPAKRQRKHGARQPWAVARRDRRLGRAEMGRV